MTIARRVGTMLTVVAMAGPAAGCAGYVGGARFGVVYVAARPPVERVEVISASPGPEFVWIRGYWSYSGAEYVWMPGRWERPREGRHEWVPHHWEHDRNGWFLVEGHWR